MRKLLLLLVAICIFFSFPFPANAGLTSVDTYLQQNPSQAAMFAAKTGLKDRVIHSAPGVLQDVGYEFIESTPGRVVKSGTAKISANPKPGGGWRGAIIGYLVENAIEFGFHSLGNSVIDSLRGKAQDNYCANNSNDTQACGQQNSVLIQWTEWGLTTKISAKVNAPGSPYTRYSIIPRSQGDFTFVTLCPSTGSCDNRQANNGSVVVTPLRPEFNTLSDAIRSAMVDALTNQDWLNALSQAVRNPLGVGNIPATADTLRVIAPGDLIIVDDDGLREIPPNTPTDIWRRNDDIDGDGIPNAQDDDIDGDGIPNADDKDGDGDGFDDNYEKYESPEQENPENQFDDVDNFVSYAIEKSRDKFPFDILGDWEFLSSGAGQTTVCPRFTFWNTEHEVCFIRDLFVGLKYSIWVGFIVKLIFHI